LPWARPSSPAQALLLGDVRLPARLDLAIPGEELPVAAGQRVQPLDTLEEIVDVVRLQEHPEISVAAEPVKDARPCRQRVDELLRRSRGDRPRGPGRGELPGEVLPGRRDELGFALRDLELQVQALDLLGQRRDLLLALRERRLKPGDPGAELLQIGVLPSEPGDAKESGGDEEGLMTQDL
jgi:hypothetical protein